MEIEPGLHRIGDDVVAAYLLVDEGGVTVIDAGLPGHRRALRRELVMLGLGEDDIRAVILTHADGDHLGFAEALRHEHGIPVYVGTHEAAYARREVKAQPSEKPKYRLGASLRFALVGLMHAGRTRALSEVVTVADGDELDLPGRPRILAMPGHTRGHIAVYAAGHEALFVGDGLTTRHVTTGEGPTDAPFSEDPQRAKASVEALRDIQTRFVLPGHGPVWRGQASDLVDAIVASRS